MSFLHWYFEAKAHILNLITSNYFALSLNSTGFKKKPQSGYNTPPQQRKQRKTQRNNQPVLFRLLIVSKIPTRPNCLKQVPAKISTFCLGDMSPGNSLLVEKAGWFGSSRWFCLLHFCGILLTCSSVPFYFL